MALIKCPECNQNISDTAKKCIHCGYKIPLNKNPKSRKKMRITFLIIIVLLLVLVMSCFLLYRNYFNKTMQKADKLYSAQSYDEALSIYKELYNMNSSDKELKEKIASSEKAILETKNRKDTYNKIQLFKNYIEELQRNKTRDGISVTMSDMAQIIKDTKKQLSDFETIKTESTDYKSYISSITSSLEYDLLKITLESKSFDDAGTSDAFGSINNDFALLNAIVVANSRNDINKFADFVSSKPIPNP